MAKVGERVRVRYVGTLEDGTEFDGSRRRGRPLKFTMGDGRMIAGFERVVSEMAAGERRTVTISAAEAYGVYDESLVEAVPEAQLPRAARLPVGSFIVLPVSGGAARVRVDRVEGGVVYLDHNHELAGHDLTFDVELLAIVR